MEQTLIQLDLFEDITEDKIRDQRIQANEMSINNLRKGLFKRHTDLANEYLKLRLEFEDTKVQNRQIIELLQYLLKKNDLSEILSKVKLDNGTSYERAS